MRIARSTILLVLLLTVTGGCSADALGPDALTITEVTVSPAGPVTDYLVVSVRESNTSSVPIRITHCFGLDLEVRDSAGPLVWRLVDGYMLALCPARYERLSPGESREWSATWGLRGHGDERLPPGTYELTPVLRELVVPDSRVARAAPVSVDIE